MVRFLFEAHWLVTEPRSYRNEDDDTVYTQERLRHDLTMWEEGTTAGTKYHVSFAAQVREGRHARTQAGGVFDSLDDAFACCEDLARRHAHHLVAQIVLRRRRPAEPVHEDKDVH